VKTLLVDLLTVAVMVAVPFGVAYGVTSGLSGPVFNLVAAYVSILWCGIEIVWEVAEYLRKDV